MSSDDPPFTIADRYDVEAEVGRGGFARVLRGQDRQGEGRTVAIKLLHPELSGGAAQERFRREIRILAELQHPSILPLLDWGEHEGSLFFVTRLVSGATLEQRLERDGKLPVDEALAITAELVEALAHAHAHAVIHRDVKPSNILFEDGHAYLHDFGIALLVAGEDGERITTTGVGIGSERYMSPEQLLGERTIDGRSDVFALACVLFEMLAGVRPFAAADLQAERRLRIQEPAPPVRRFRPPVPEHVDEAIAIALQKDPADRYQSVADFGAALGLRTRSGRFISNSGNPSHSPARGTNGARDAGTPTSRLPRNRLLALAGIFALGGALAGWLAINGNDARLTSIAALGGTESLDTTRYVVFPFDATEPAAAASWDQLIADAIARWDGVHAVDLFQVRDALARRGSTSPTQDDFRAVTRALGAGRFVRGELTNGSGKRRVRAVLYDTERIPAIANTSAELSADDMGADTAATRLVESLLFRDAPPEVEGAATRETSSRPARAAFLAGMRALQSWSLAAAESSFAAATSADDRYARAAFWRAQVRAWRSDDGREWAPAAQRVSGSVASLTPRERRLAEALTLLATGDYPGACSAYRRILAADSLDFTAWFGLGECRRRDAAVVRDAASPSGWRFRSSYHAAYVAYRRAFELVPSSGREVYRTGFERLSSILMPSATSMRAGRALGDTLVFYAQPAWDARGDTLALVPRAPSDFATSPTATLGTALRRNRLALRTLVAAWTTAFPSDPDALEARAFAEELVGDRAALATVRAAIAGASGGAQRLRLRITEVLLLVRFGAPDSVALLREAATRADSLLEAMRTPPDSLASWLAALAALRGRTDDVTRLARLAATSFPLGAGDVRNIPREASAAKEAFDVHAAALTSPDSIRWWATRMRSLLEGVFAEGEARAIAARLGAHGRWLAIPLVDPREIPGEQDELSLVGAAAHRGDTAVVRAYLRRQETMTRVFPAIERSLDIVALEAWLLTRVGDDRTAALRLDASLGALSNVSPEQLRSPLLVFALMRCARLRLEVATRLGDVTTARRWGAFLDAATAPGR